MILAIASQYSYTKASPVRFASFPIVDVKPSGGVPADALDPFGQSTANHVHPADTMARVFCTSIPAVIVTGNKATHEEASLEMRLRSLADSPRDFRSGAQPALSLRRLQGMSQRAVNKMTRRESAHYRVLSPCLYSVLRTPSNTVWGMLLFLR